MSMTLFSNVASSNIGLNGDIAVEAHNVPRLLWQLSRRQRYWAQNQKPQHHRLHWALWLRQKHCAAYLQPDERSGCQC